MKEAIFHPEARAEVRESVEFYEAHLNGLGLRFLAAVEGTAERISANPEAGAPLGVEFRKRIVLVFPTASSIGSGRITFIWLPLLTTTGVRAIGASESTVANHRLQRPPGTPTYCGISATLFRAVIYGL